MAKEAGKYNLQLYSQVPSPEERILREREQSYHMLEKVVLQKDRVDYTKQSNAKYWEQELNT